jgi:hypothetical protein
MVESQQAGKKVNNVSSIKAIFYKSKFENGVSLRVARFFLVHDTKTGKNVPNEHKMYQMVIKYPKWP